MTEQDPIRKEVGRWTHPTLSEKIGLVTGATIFLVGYGVQRRRARLARIEEKLDEVAEEVVDDND